jgi:basic membrane lipoprotein Med (substrate-binding protein (PBP1-ABC) superfamily)
VAGALVVVITGLLTWAVWPSPAPGPRARQYGETTACLLTDQHGVTGTAAAPVWAGMREASEATLTKVQYLEVDGPQTADNAKTYLASLVQSRCDLVLAVGAGPVSAVDVEAGRFPRARFALVGGGTPAANVSLVDGTTPEAVRANVRAIVAAVKPAAQ